MQTQRITQQANDAAQRYGDQDYGIEAARDNAWTLVHELRQPMTLVSAHAQLARKQLRTNVDRADAELSEIVAQIARIDRMLSEVLADLRSAKSANETIA